MKAWSKNNEILTQNIQVGRHYLRLDSQHIYLEYDELCLAPHHAKVKWSAWTSFQKHK